MGLRRPCAAEEDLIRQNAAAEIGWAALRERGFDSYIPEAVFTRVKPDFNSCGGTMCEQFSQVIDFIEREFSDDFWCGAK